MTQRLSQNVMYDVIWIILSSWIFHAKSKRQKRLSKLTSDSHQL